MFNSETISLRERSLGYIIEYVTRQLIFGLHRNLFKQANSAVNFQRKQQLCCPHPPPVLNPDWGSLYRAKPHLRPEYCFGFGGILAFIFFTA